MCMCMLSSVKKGYFIEFDELCEAVLDRQRILAKEDFEEFIIMFGEGAFTFLTLNKVYELYNETIKEDMNVYVRLAMFVAEVILDMFDEQVLPEEGVYVIYTSISGGTK